MITVRNACLDDVPILMRLIKEMSRYERLPLLMSANRLARDGFGSDPQFHAIIADVNSRPAGYALFFNYYCSFRGAGTFLEDLYVRPSFRRKGVGNALLSRITDIAKTAGHFGIMFHILEWNDTARDFFQSQGASALARRTFELL